MENLHLLEINLVLIIQSLGEWLFYIMRGLSFLGDETFFIFGLALLYWGVHSRLGLRIAVLLILSISVNTFFKVLFAYPRPFWVDSNVKALTTETSFGFPSGHAQNSTAIWGLVERTVRRPVVSGFTIALVALIGLSRIYLGVHFFSDVIGGWLLGLVLLLAFLRLERKSVNWIHSFSLREKILAVVLSTLVLLIFLLVPYALQQGWELPREWIAISGQASPGYTPDPLLPENPFTLSGVWLGMLGGAAWFTHTHGEFRSGGSVTARVLRCLIGAVGLLVIRFGLGAIFPGEADWISLFLRLVRYALLGAWVSVGAPLMYRWMKLSG
jgi:membrane-associated phospholipid phosphatase